MYKLFWTLSILNLLLSSNLIGQIYWSNSSGSIGKANLDRTNISNSFIPNLSSSLLGIEVDGTNSKVYWANFNQNAIGSANLDGSNVNTLFITGLSGPAGVAIDPSNNKIYWTNFAGGSIGRANLDGTNINNNFISGIGGRPSGLTIDNNNKTLYWTDVDNNVIGKAELSPLSITKNFITGIGARPDGISVDHSNDKLYWSNSSSFSIGRANLDGTSIQNSFISGLSAQAAGTEVDEQNGRLLWCIPTENKIAKADLNGTNIVTSFITGIGTSPVVLDIQSNGTLPITWGSFYAKKNVNGVQLIWSTLEEHDNEGFLVQKMKNNHWDSIGFVKGQLHSSILSEYSYFDSNPSLGISYYRIKQLDFNGAFSYSKVLSVNNNSTSGQIKVFPNPANGILNIENSSVKEINGEITDASGKLVYKFLLIEPKQRIHVHFLESGVYNLKLSDSSSKLLYSIRFIKH